GNRSSLSEVPRSARAEVTPGPGSHTRKADGGLMATLSTRLTKALDIRYPVLSAPMAFAAGGGLAAAVSRAGGLGLIGGGYGDPSWLAEQFEAAAGAPVGVGFITWSLRKSPS